MSSSINALVAVTVEDFINPQCKNLTEKQVTWMNMGLSKFCKAIVSTLPEKNHEFENKWLSETGYLKKNIYIL